MTAEQFALFAEQNPHLLKSLSKDINEKIRTKEDQKKEALAEWKVKNNYKTPHEAREELDTLLETDDSKMKIAEMKKHLAKIKELYFFKQMEIPEDLLPTKGKRAKRGEGGQDGNNWFKKKLSAIKTGEAHKCPHCSKCFFSADALARHIKKENEKQSAKGKPLHETKKYAFFEDTAENREFWTRS